MLYCVYNYTQLALSKKTILRCQEEKDRVRDRGRERGWEVVFKYLINHRNLTNCKRATSYEFLWNELPVAH